MIEQTARRTIWSVYRANKTPCLWQQLTDCRRFHFSEVLTTMNTSKMGQVTSVVKFVCYDREACRLLEVELRACHKIASSQEILKFLADARL